MKRILGRWFAPALVLVLVGTAARAAPDDGWILNDSNATVTHDCTRQPRVVINASQDHVTLIGPCSRVTANGHDLTLTIETAAALAVHGAGNQVDVATVGSIAVTGAQNKVVWKSGPAGRRPRITQTGGGNTISKAP